MNQVHNKGKNCRIAKKRKYDQVAKAHDDDPVYKNDESDESESDLEVFGEMDFIDEDPMPDDEVEEEEEGGYRANDMQQQSQRVAVAKVMEKVQEDPEEGKKEALEILLKGGGRGPTWANVNQFWRKYWSRPALDKPLDSHKEDLVFQMYEIDYENVDNHTYKEVQHNLIGNKISKAPVLRLFGTNKSGQSILARIHGFLPYGYVPVPDLGIDTSTGQPRDLNDPDVALGACLEMKRVLEVELKKPERIPYTVADQPVVSVELVFRAGFNGYMDPKCRIPYFKVTMALPCYIPKLRAITEEGFFFNGRPSIRESGSGISCETDFPFTSRFTTDMQIKSGQWLKLPAGKYHVVDSRDQKSDCSAEVMIRYEDLVAIPLSGEGGDSSLSPLRILSFDIECTSTQGFPNPENKGDHIVQIGNSLIVHDGEQRRPYIDNVFCFRETASIGNGITVHYYDTEEEMLLAWQMFVVISDPDIITGYNILNFDLWYIWERVAFLKIDKTFTDMSRIMKYKVKMRKQTSSSRAHGTRDSHTFTFAGRVIADYLPALSKSDKMRSYKLDNVAFEILGERKEDVDYSEIPKLWNGTPEDRARLARYCHKDAYLVIRLILKKLFIVSSIEMVRLTGITLNDLLTKGQTVKVYTFIHGWNRNGNLGYAIPTRNKGDRDRASAANNGKATFEGAVVIDPLKGFYEGFIPTLDFASLYPSIMMAHNLCYTTFIRDLSIIAKNGWKEGEDYTKTPAGFYFVTPKIRRGVLPQILDYLLKERSAVKKEIGKATDPFMKSLLDQRQLTIKVAANSVYGFTGATTGPIYLMAISASVTAFGREMINTTRNAVMEKYSIKNGHHCDSQVIYGDTDSVMVNFGAKTLEEAISLGKEAAKYVTTLFKNPISLTWEKVYHPYLLISKKRYVGMKYLDNGELPAIDAKGVETVRRDNCQIVKESLEKTINTILLSKPANILSSSQEIVKAASLHSLGQMKIQEWIEALAATKGGNKAQSDEYDLIYLILKGYGSDKEKVITTKQLFDSISDCTREKALTDAQEVIKALRMRKVPLSDLIISKQYAKPQSAYKVIQPHLEVNRKMIKRGEAGYVTGDRIDYVVVAGPKHIKPTLRAEDPKFAEKNRFAPCLTFYSEQFLRPQVRLLKHVVSDAEKRLRNGDHMRFLAIPTRAAQPGLITMFTKPLVRCQECGTNYLPKSNVDGGCDGEWCEKCVQEATKRQEEEERRLAEEEEDDIDVEGQDGNENDQMEVENDGCFAIASKVKQMLSGETAGHSSLASKPLEYYDQLHENTSRRRRGKHFDINSFFIPLDGKSKIKKYLQTGNDNGKRRKLL